MTLAHHPEGDLLLAYAAGGTDAAISLILATHLTFCPECRAAVAAAEQAGGIMLEDLPPAPLGNAALENTLARLGPPEARKTPTASHDRTPRPLRAWLGRDLGQMRWRRLGARLAYIPLYRRSGVRMRLLKGAPGADVGRHDHRGLEYTLVLTGGYSDQTGSYASGDFQTAAPGLRHNPKADTEGCTNLAVTTAPLRFDDLIPRMVAPLFGF